MFSHFLSNLGLSLFGSVFIYIMLYSRIRNYWAVLEKNYYHKTIQYIFIYIVILLTTIVPFMFFHPDSFDMAAVEYLIMLIFVTLDSVLLSSVNNKNNTDNFILSIMLTTGLAMIINAYSIDKHWDKLNSVAISNEIAKREAKEKEITDTVMDKVDVSFIKAGYSYRIDLDEYDLHNFKVKNDMSVCKNDGEYGHSAYLEEADVESKLITDLKPLIKVESFDKDMIIGKAIIMENNQNGKSRPCEYSFIMTTNKIKKLIAYGSKIELIGIN